MMRIRVLGCGDSGGIPRLGNDWGRCDPKNPKNNRTRMSVAIESEGERWLIDTSPDLKHQLLRESIDQVDGLFFTHSHADHVLGLDELRVLYFLHKKSLPVYGDPQTLRVLRSMFGYLFQEGALEGPAIYPQFLMPHEVTSPFQWQGMPIIPFSQNHGYSQSLGYRFPAWAYSTDVVTLDDTAFSVLQGLKVWFVDCIGYDPKPSHSHLDQTLDWIDRLKPERAILIHMSKFLDYEELSSKLPPRVEPAYDGMVVEID
ncbi:MAG: MBL fold metallo-hydrolase [Holosporales bacterium]|jgi:phosphoribosyl 1,2-cyclic phosphate phosphodiesterase|nr:MBL fold metallo-hydrolase [Holosporales bacterium]